MPLSRFSYFTILLFLPIIILYAGTALSAEAFKPDSYTYVLQADEIADSSSQAAEILRESDRQLIIIDPFFSNNERWSKAELDRIRSGMPGRKITAYLSIGEAEDYRPYWQSGWNNPEQRPSYILEENPDWPGNFKVRYWNPDWQNLIFKELEQIAKAGFDGVFLDIVDGFEYFEETEEEYIDYRVNEETGNTYRSDMIELIRKIRTRLDSNANSTPLLIPQNGAQLLESQLYQDLISAQAIEDLFTSGDTAQPSEHSDYILNFLSSLTSNGKIVLLTEYPAREKFKKLSRASAAKHGFTLLLTDRALNEIGISD